MRNYRRRFLAVGLLALLTLLVGTVGFLQFPGWSFSDALYMTMITLTAVGYEEVRPLTDLGRLLAGGLLASGITLMGLYFALITSTIVEMDLANVFRTRRLMKQIENMEDHVIVCGAGRTGRRIFHELEHAGEEYVVVEIDAGRAEYVREHFPRARVLEADATRDETLHDSGIHRARALVAALSSDTDNLFITLSARDDNPALNIVARAQAEEAADKIRRAGADHVVSPQVIGGIRMASMLLRPEVMSFLDVITGAEGLSLRLEEVEVPEGSTLSDHSLAEAQIPQKTGLIVIAVRHTEGEDGLIYNPGPDERLQAGDVLIVMGRPDQVDQLRETVAA